MSYRAVCSPLPNSAPTPGATTKADLVDRLEGAGYVRRGPHPHDRRLRTVSATSLAMHQLVEGLQPLAGDIEHAAAG